MNMRDYATLCLDINQNKIKEQSLYCCSTFHRVLYILLPFIFVIFIVATCDSDGSGYAV